MTTELDVTRGIGWTAFAAAIVALLGLVLWMDGDERAGEPAPSPVMPPTTTRDAPTTELPAGVADETVQPLQAPLLDAGAPAGSPIASGGDDEVHAWPFQELSLSGRVVDASGRPLENVEVILNPSRNSRQQHGLPASYFMEEPAWDAYPRTTSAADGTFAFTAQEAGDSDGSRIPASNSFENSTALVARLPGYVPSAVLVPSDGWTVPMGDLVLEEAGLVSGRIVDPTGRPLPGLRIAISDYGRRHGGSEQPSWSLVSRLIEAYSQADGRFRLDTLEPGSYRLEIVGEGYQVHSLDVDVAVGQHLDVGELVILPGLVLAGRVVDQDGVGLAGATLKARPSTLLNLSPGEDTALRDIQVVVMSSSGDREVSVESGPDGEFRFSDLVDKEYVLLAKQEHREPVALAGLRPDRLDLELVLAREALLVLRVVDGETKQPVWCNVTIRRNSSRDAEQPDAMDPGLTVLEHAAAARRLGLGESGDGLYVAGPAGFVGHHLRITSEEYAPLETTLPGLQAGEIHEQTIELIRASTISGRVTDAEGKPLAAAEVTAVAMESAPGARAERLRDRSADDGTYTVSGLAEGQWTVQAALVGHVPMEPILVTLGVAQQLEGVDLDLHLGARVSGIVFRADGLPAPAHHVQSWRLGDDGELVASSTTRTGADGRYLLSGLPDGPLTLTAEPGARAEVLARRSAEAEVDLALRRPARLVGRVTDASGAPVSCEVRYRADKDEWQTAETRSNEQGEFVMDDLPPGAGLVYASLDRARTPTVEVDLEFDRTEVRDLAFSGGRIIGRVILDDTGAALAGIRVRALERDEGEQDLPRGIEGMQSHGLTDDDGRFELGSLSPGLYNLWLSSAEYVPLEPGPEEVTLEGASASRDLRVTHAATLRGQVSAVGDLSKDDLGLRLIRIADGFERFGGVPSEGSYQLKGLPAGDYRYEVKHHSHWPALPDQDHVFASGEVSMVSGQATLHDIVLIPATGH